MASSRGRRHVRSGVGRSSSDLARSATKEGSGEQDQLGVVLANLECAAPLYGSTDFRSNSAKNILDLIDKAVEIMSKHGLLQGQVDKPWDD